MPFTSLSRSTFSPPSLSILICIQQLAWSIVISVDIQFILFVVLLICCCLVECWFSYPSHYSYSNIVFCFIEEMEMKLGSLNISPITDSTSTMNIHDDNHNLAQRTSSPRLQSSQTVRTDVLTWLVIDDGSSQKQFLLWTCECRPVQLI